MICMTVRRKKNVDLRLSPLKQSFQIPRKSDVGPANSDIIIERKKMYEQFVNKVWIQTTFQ